MRARIIAAQVWEAVIMASPAAQDRAMAECTKVISLIARQVGVPGAGAPHPDPVHEARRVQERTASGMILDNNRTMRAE